MKNIFALVDCNNFYASCEMVFNPSLKGRPVIVLSNNDGCIVARSNEAKKLGIGMGVPAFKVKEIIEKNNVCVFSSNYCLYADMSSRVMETLLNFSPLMEIYSIDEAFLNLAGIEANLHDYARKMKEIVYKWTGIDVSIGIGRTKTIAKIANKIAKKSKKADGVLDLTDSPYLDKALLQTTVEDIWGVGHKTAEKLKKIGITTAFELKNAKDDLIRSKFGINILRTAYELRGQECYQLDDNPPPQKNLAVTRTFGNEIEDIEKLKEAVANYAARAGEKLRENGLAASVITVFANTNRFKEKAFFKSYTIELDFVTSDSFELIRNAVLCTEKIFKKGLKFKKAGVILGGLASDSNIQLALFENNRLKMKKLMETIDVINSKYDGSIMWAAEGVEKDWGVKFSKKSKRYTTSWDELPQVK